MTTPGQGGGGAEPAAGGRLGLWLHIAGIVIICVTLVAQSLRGALPIWVRVVAALALAGWLAAVVLPARWRLTVRIALVVAALAGAVGAMASSGVLIAPLIVGVMYVTRSEAGQLWGGSVLATASAGAVAVGGLLTPGTTVGDLLAPWAGVFIGFLGGVNRRRARERDRQRLELARRDADMREERARLAASAIRQDAARELHDVLAHSLGALVIQLDATEALLESGRLGRDQARERVRAARELAASGLGEARRAVEVLRHPVDEASAVSADAVRAQIDDLIEVHRNLGGTLTLTVEGEDAPAAREAAPGAVPGAVAAAVRRALQEALSNARKHAPSAPVDVLLRWRPDAVVLRVRNPLVASADRGSLAGSGGGRGLNGMAERFAALPGGRATATARDGEFVVEVAATLGRPSGSGAGDGPPERQETTPGEGSGR